MAVNKNHTASSLDPLEQRSLALYEQMINTSEDLIILLDRTFNIAAVNNACLQTYQISRPEVLGISIEKIVGQLFFQQRIDKRLRETITGEKVRFQCWFKFPDIGRRYMDVIMTPFIDEKGVINGVMISLRDSTGAHLVREALIESEHRFRVLFENAPYGIFVCQLIRDGHGRIEDLIYLYGNRAVFHATGIHHENLADKMASSLCREADFVQVLNIYKEVANKQISKSYTQFFPYFNKSLEVTASPFENDFIILTFNETGIFKSALKTSDERLKMLLTASESGTWDWNIKTGKIVFDKHWFKITGYSPEDFDCSFSSWIELVHEDDIERLTEDVNKHFLNLTDHFHHEYRFRHKEGHYIWLSDNGKIVERDDSGNPLRMIGMDSNITHQREQEEKLRRSQKLDALGNLTGGIAHDFNNLLGIISGYTFLLKKYLIDQPIPLNYVHQIANASDRGSKLTKKLLSFTTKQSLQEEEVDINKLLCEQKDMLQKTLTVRIKLIYELQDNVWHVLLDESQLEDAVLNLSINAMHAMENNTSDSRLTISVCNRTIDEVEAEYIGLESGSYVQLSLTDTGCGMNEKTIEKIFDPFYTTKGKKGTGLGLSQVFGFVARSKGAIQVISEPDIGSQFILFFPRYSTDEEKITDKLDEEFESKGNERILLVDDEASLLLSMSEILQQNGYEIFTASSAKKALKVLDSEDIDLLITDVIMPEMDGYELAKEVAEKYPNTKIIFSSGYNGDKHIDKVDNISIQSVVQKPFDTNVLLKKIRFQLERDINNDDILTTSKHSV